MPTLVLDPQPTVLEQLLDERTRLDLDRHDEVWDGVLHVIPPPSHAHELLATHLVRLLGPYADEAGLELTGGVGIGTGKESYRVPDLALHRPGGAAQWHPTAALAAEIVSPNDETWDKLPFYASRQVDELLIVDPQQRKVHWQALESGEYCLIEQSRLIDLGASELAQRIDWPPIDDTG